MIAKIRRVLVVLVFAYVCSFFLGSFVLRAGNVLTTAIDRVDEALQEGQITLKKAVLLKAKILFAPQEIEVGSTFSPGADEDLGLEVYRLELFEDVRRVFNKLSGPVKRYLSSLSPELKQVIKEAESGVQREKITTRQSPPTTFQRVCKAQDNGEITPKEAVLAKANLLFAPQDVKDQRFKVQAGEIPAAEKCLTGFYKDVHIVYDQLAEDEKVFLSTLSPDINLIMTTKELEKSGASNVPPVLAVPSFYPDLNLSEKGTNCIVHYTLNGANAAPDKVYAELVRLYMDKAIKSKMTTHFKKAYTEGFYGYQGKSGKLHVYLGDIGSRDGSWIDESTVNGNKKAGYIVLNTNLSLKYGATWQLSLKGVIFHEYFHGIQSAYNFDSDRWFLEASSVWASCYYGHDWAGVGIDYIDSDSVFNKPNDFIWSTTGQRRYSMSALAFYLSDKYKGYEIIKTYFETSETNIADDGVTILSDVLNQKGTSFSDQYRMYLASLYFKKIASIEKYMPDVKIETTHNAYGVNTTSGSVYLTGANFYQFYPEPKANPGTFIATFTAGSNGSPEGFLVKQSKKQLSIHPFSSSTGRAYLTKFGVSVKPAVMITTDIDSYAYAGKDTSARTYNYTAIVPYIAITNLTAVSPIRNGESSQITMDYDLTGTVVNKNFNFQLTVTLASNVDDYVTGEYDSPVGKGLKKIFYFNTYGVPGDEGTYQFTFGLKVPPDSWSPIPQVESKKSCTVVVTKAPLVPVNRAPQKSGRGSVGVIKPDLSPEGM